MFLLYGFFSANNRPEVKFKHTIRNIADDKLKQYKPERYFF